MSETPPEGKTWITIQVPNHTFSPTKDSVYGYPVVKRVVGPTPETRDQAARRHLARAAANLRKAAESIGPWGQVSETTRLLKLATDHLASGVENL